MIASCLAALVSASAILAAPPIRRARPPRFSKAINDAFFPDAFQALVGPRPESTDRAALATAPAARQPEPPSSIRGTPTWSKLVSAEVVEDEIKSQQRKLSASVENATAFKAGGYRDARASLTLLATLFAIDAQFDDKMRWQDVAAAMRDATARAGLNCKVGTDASYREARRVADDVESLIRGGSAAAVEANAEIGWEKVADRALLMKRLEDAQQHGLAPWTASAGEFSRHADKLAHEAQLVAALAEVIQGRGYELADDETYREYARSMQAQALAVREAVEQKNHAAARQAAGEVSKACAACHEGYRN
jgi:hypothetical protein